jgi:predicted Zn-ribbon and HTH transcriptional regulator
VRTDGSVRRQANGKTICRECARASSNKWKLANPEYKKVRNARRRQANEIRLVPQRKAICKGCGVEFQRSIRGHRRLYCDAACSHIAANNKTPKRWRWLWDRYKITREHYESILARQHGCCAICSKALRGTGLEKLAPQLDHCHETGGIRGILCRSCNTAIGALGDDEALLLRAIDYIRSHRLEFVA